VVVGEGTFLGLGSGVIPGIRIGRWSVIGAGAVVTKDIPDNCTAVGVPAKVIKTRGEGWHLA
jgi:UDP-perosamine 4-acetyltransferase